MGRRSRNGKRDLVAGRRVPCLAARCPVSLLSPGSRRQEAENPGCLEGHRQREKDRTDLHPSAYRTAPVHVLN